jgi:hypothetical protein
LRFGSLVAALKRRQRLYQSNANAAQLVAFCGDEDQTFGVVPCPPVAIPIIST